MKKILDQVIDLYQSAAPAVFGANCRFYPSCSEYARTAIKRLGLIRGVWLSSLRILRCNPLNPGGFDPVPDVQKDV